MELSQFKTVEQLAAAINSLIGESYDKPFLVAASDAAAATIARADYICDGTADDVQIQAALDALPAVGGKVLLSEGTFTIAAQINIGNKESLCGQGPDATIIKVANSTQINALKLASNAGDLIISDLTVDGNDSNQTDGLADTNQNGLYLANGTNFRVIVDNVKSVDNYYNGFVVSGYEFRLIGCSAFGNGVNGATDAYGIHLSQSYGSKVLGCVVGNDNAGMANAGGIYLNISNRNAIMGNNVYHTTDYSGIILSSTCYDNQVLGNWVAYSDKYGIELNSAIGNVISENTICYCDKEGIELDLVNTKQNIVSNNTIYNNGQLAANTYDAIKLYQTSRNIVIGNLCFDNQGTQTQRYGISEESTSDYNLIAYNHVKDNLATIRTSGSNTIMQHNLGHVTENSGTSSITSGQTTKVVAHGCSDTPTLINISFIEQGTSDYGRWWVDTIGSANFTLNVSVDPGASNLDFAWEAKVR